MSGKVKISPRCTAGAPGPLSSLILIHMAKTDDEPREASLEARCPAPAPSDAFEDDLNRAIAQDKRGAHALGCAPRTTKVGTRRSRFCRRHSDQLHEQERLATATAPSHQAWRDSSVHGLQQATLSRQREGVLSVDAASVGLITVQKRRT